MDEEQLLFVDELNTPLRKNKRRKISLAGSTRKWLKPSLKYVEDTSMEDFFDLMPDSTQPDESTPSQKLSPLNNNLENFRRFSSRSKKKTDFFIPQIPPLVSSNTNKSNGNGNMRSVRRALNFDQTRITTNDNNNNSNSSASGITLLANDVTFPAEHVIPPATDDTSESPYSTPQKIPVIKDVKAAAMASDKSLVKSLKPQETFSQGDDKLPVNWMVWGKIPGYDWWPGYILSYEKGKPDVELEDEDIIGNNEVVAMIKWFGDNQLSQVPCHKIHSFGEFIDYFIPTKLKGLYKKAVFTALKDAAKKCNKVMDVKDEDKKPCWIFCPVYLPQWLEVKDRENTVSIDSLPEEEGKIMTQLDNSPVRFPDSSSSTSTSNELLFQSFSSLDENNSSKGNKRKTKNNRILLTSIEKDLLEWALLGFPPKGFRPIDDDASELEDKEEANDTKTAGRDKVASAKAKIQFELVAQGKLNIEDVCLSCGSTSVIAQHPLFAGGFCRSCKEVFMECAYLFDDDGTQMYCTLCSGGTEVFMCDTPNCSKVYCGPCIEKLCGLTEKLAVQESLEWQCYMCSEVGNVGLLQKREDWDHKLHELFLNDNEMEYEPAKFISPIPADERKPLRVLGLFDGIGTGLLVLKELGFNVEVYVGSEIDPDAIKVSRVNHPEMIHVGAIEYITEKEIHSWGPFDLVIGGSPCNDLSIVNPARKGIYEGTGRLFFEFFRVLSYAKPPPGGNQPFFWLYENVVSMRAQDKQIISRFLQCNPVVVDAKEISAAHRARYFWGNLPGMNRPSVPLPGDRLTLQDCLEPNCFRHAQFNKLRTITTKMNSIKQTKKALFPVSVGGGGMLSDPTAASDDDDVDVLWCTEMERLFGFPEHYTDVGNLGRCGRQKLLGKAWSVPVIRHLFSPLKDYYQSNTTGVPSTAKISSAPHDDPPDGNDSTMQGSVNVNGTTSSSLPI